MKKSFLDMYDHSVDCMMMLGQLINLMYMTMGASNTLSAARKNADQL